MPQDSIAQPVRLGILAAFGAAAFVALLPGAAAAPLLATPHTAICFLDINGDGRRGLDEPVFLQQSCAGGTAPVDARLFAWAGHPGGTLVNGSHEDAGLPTTTVAATYAFQDADGGGGYNLGDPLFLAFGPIPGPARPGDIPLTGDDSFQSLQGNDSRLGRPLLAAPVAVGGESYSERDGNLGFTTGDAVYLDLDGNGQTSLGDLRLAVPATPPSAATPSQSPSTTDPPTPVPQGPMVTPGNASDAPGLSRPPTSSKEQGRGTPVPSMWVPVALGLAVALCRRPH